jgi:hypothetical protein
VEESRSNSQKENDASISCTSSSFSYRGKTITGGQAKKGREANAAFGALLILIGSAIAEGTVN